ncbi:uncharacterized protein LOC116610130 isoform X2 [Nematostella vectensis]|nr:uncharacterized protein LOC116610130 isoform X2 [Nematostella vectensis]
MENSSLIGKGTKLTEFFQQHNARSTFDQQLHGASGDDATSLIFPALGALFMLLFGGLLLTSASACCKSFSSNSTGSQSRNEKHKQGGIDFSAFLEEKAHPQVSSVLQQENNDVVDAVKKSYCELPQYAPLSGVMGNVPGMRAEAYSIYGHVQSKTSDKGLSPIHEVTEESDKNIEGAESKKNRNSNCQSETRKSDGIQNGNDVEGISKLEKQSDVVSSSSVSISCDQDELYCYSHKRHESPDSRVSVCLSNHMRSDSKRAENLSHAEGRLSVLKNERAPSDLYRTAQDCSLKQSNDTNTHASTTDGFRQLDNTARNTPGLQVSNQSDTTYNDAIDNDIIESPLGRFTIEKWLADVIDRDTSRQEEPSYDWKRKRKLSKDEQREILRRLQPGIQVKDSSEGKRKGHKPFVTGEIVNRESNVLKGGRLSRLRVVCAPSEMCIHGTACCERNIHGTACCERDIHGTACCERDIHGTACCERDIHGTACCERDIHGTACCERDIHGTACCERDIHGTACCERDIHGTACCEHCSEHHQTSIKHEEQGFFSGKSQKHVRVKNITESKPRNTDVVRGASAFADSTAEMSNSHGQQDSIRGASAFAGWNAGLHAPDLAGKSFTLGDNKAITRGASAFSCSSSVGDAADVRGASAFAGKDYKKSFHASSADMVGHDIKGGADIRGASTFGEKEIPRGASGFESPSEDNTSCEKSRNSIRSISTLQRKLLPRGENSLRSRPELVSLSAAGIPSTDAIIDTVNGAERKAGLPMRNADKHQSRKELTDAERRGFKMQGFHSERASSKAENNAPNWIPDASYPESIASNHRSSKEQSNHGQSKRKLRDFMPDDKHLGKPEAHSTRESNRLFDCAQSLTRRPGHHGYPDETAARLTGVGEALTYPEIIARGEEEGEFACPEDTTSLVGTSSVSLSLAVMSDQGEPMDEFMRGTGPRDVHRLIQKESGDRCKSANEALTVKRRIQENNVSIASCAGHNEATNHKLKRHQSCEELRRNNEKNVDIKQLKRFFSHVKSTTKIRNDDNESQRMRTGSHGVENIEKKPDSARHQCASLQMLNNKGICDDPRRSSTPKCLLQESDERRTLSRNSIEPIASLKKDPSIEPIASLRKNHSIEPIASRGKNHSIEPIASLGKNHSIEPIASLGKNPSIEAIASRGKNHSIEPIASRGKNPSALSGLLKALKRDKQSRSSLSQKQTGNISNIEESFLSYNGEAMGKLDFCLFYDRMNCRNPTLYVTVLQATNLSLDFESASSIHIETCIESENPQWKKTKTVRSGENSVFNDLIVISGLKQSELSNAILQFLLVSDNIQRACANASISLAPLKSRDKLKQTCSLQRTLVEDDDTLEGRGRHDQQTQVPVGALYLGLKYSSLEEQLLVQILKARGLPAMTKTGETDPFILLTVKDPGSVVAERRTSVQRSQRNPVFDSKHVIDIQITRMPLATLELLVIHKGIAKNRSIGNVRIGMDAGKDGMDHWNEILCNPDDIVHKWHQIYK